MSSALVLVLNLAATWYMVGLIWFVQLVHYAQFRLVGADGFAAYHRRHARVTTWAVGPAMLVELAMAAWLVARRPAAMPAWAAWAGAGMIGLLWASTALVQVPKHAVLARGFDGPAGRALVATNWVRTILFHSPVSIVRNAGGRVAWASTLARASRPGG